jgi:zinc protease
MLDATSFTVYGTPRGEATLEQVEQAINKQIERIAKDGVTDDELEKAKKRFVRATIFARDRQISMANMYGSALATGATVQDLQEWPDRIGKVTAEEVRAAAVRYLQPSISTTGYLLPTIKAGN